MVITHAIYDWNTAESALILLLRITTLLCTGLQWVPWLCTEVLLGKYNTIVYYCSYGLKWRDFSTAAYSEAGKFCFFLPLCKLRSWRIIPLNGTIWLLSCIKQKEEAYRTCFTHLASMKVQTSIYTYATQSATVMPQNQSATP